MQKASDLFCTVERKAIEGCFDECNMAPELLYVLHEPHAKEQDVTDFWFREKVLKYKRFKNPYYKAFSRIAELLLGREKGNDIEVLNCCAFINAFPFCGESYASDDCKSVIEEIGNVEAAFIPGITKDSPKEMIAANRKYIIENTTAKCIVTTRSIFDILKPARCVQGLGYSYPYKGKTIEKSFLAAEYHGKILVSCYHPGFKYPYYNKEYVYMSDELKMLIRSKQ